MSVSDSYLTFVLEQLSGVPNVITKRMFGGIGIYSDGTFFAVIDNDTLFFKVDETLAKRYRDKRMPPFAPIPGAKPMMGYYQVPPDILEDQRALGQWARDSIASAKDRIGSKVRPAVRSKVPTRRKKPAPSSTARRK
jgi:DNA transformation protein and related proteins